MEREQPGQCRDSRHGKSNTWKEQTGLSRRQRPGTAQHARSIPWSAHRATRGSKRWMARLVRCALSEEEALFLHVVVVVVLVLFVVVFVFVVVVFVVVVAAGDGLAALELVEGERAAPRAAEEDAGITGRRLFRGEEGDRLRVHLAEGAVRVGDAGVLRPRGGREVLHKEQLCVWGVGHVEDEGRALLLGRGDHDRPAACLSDDDRLRPGAILERALIDRLAERAGAVVLVASGAPGHGGVVHVAAVLVDGGEGVELPNVVLQLVAGVAFASHEVGRDGADLAGGPSRLKRAPTLPSASLTMENSSSATVLCAHGYLAHCSVSRMEPESQTRLMSDAFQMDRPRPPKPTVALYTGAVGVE
mmetsp:Transcript_47249/g.156609  ORF Transcript_47249/g.156609 Transcript_47249/m.156609 type:complete len:360 (+) Transcript_47249:149-1228(+)